MSDETSVLPPAAPPRSPSGAGKVLIGFTIGALFGLVPMYYFYSGREAALRGALSVTDDAGVRAENARGEADAGREPRLPQKWFASRLTYELSQVPEEPVMAVARATPQLAPAVPAPAVTATTPAVEDSAAARVANARPISAVPPPQRDRTTAIELETQRQEARDPARSQGATPSPRVVEGRDVELKPRLPDTPTRPIVAGSTNTRAEIEAERARLAAEVARAWPQPAGADAAKAAKDARTPPVAVAVASPTVASTPIAKPPEATARADREAAPKAAPAPDTAGVAATSVEGRLTATREWLASAPQTTHTIQLMGTNSEEQLKLHLRSLSKVLEPSRIYVFRTMAQGKPSITVVYGAYPDKQAAVQALEKLPPALAANRPVLRTVNGIRAEMKQHKTDS